MRKNSQIVEIVGRNWLVSERPHDLNGTISIGQLRLARTIRCCAAAGFVFTLAAVPGIAKSPQFRQTAPVPASEIELAVLGCAVLVGFGVILGLIWNRMNARRTNSATGEQRSLR